MLQKLNQDDVITNRQSDLKNEIQSVLVKIGGRQSKQERLYEDFTDGILSPEEYMQMKEQYDQEYQSLNAQLNQLQHEQAKLNKALSNHWMVHMQRKKLPSQNARNLFAWIRHEAQRRIAPKGGRTKPCSKDKSYTDSGRIQDDAFEGDSSGRLAI